MQGKRPKKNSLQFIVHLLFNGDTGKVQITKRNACTFIYIMPRWAYSLSVAVGIVPRAAMWAKKRTDSPSAATASGVLCQLRCHTCLELGSVYPIRSERAPILYHASYAMMRFISAWCLSVLPLL